MNRTILAAILATTGFAAVAAGPLVAQTAPAPQADPDGTQTREEALAQADAGSTGWTRTRTASSMRPR